MEIPRLPKMNIFFVSFLVGCLALVLAHHHEDVVWCVKSAQEKSKCDALAAAISHFTCIEKSGSEACMEAIKSKKADATVLDGEDIYKAGLPPYNLYPIIAEDYGSAAQDTCYYAVAVVKDGTGFDISDLRERRSCHTGLGSGAGWNIPIGTLLGMGYIRWTPDQDKSVEKMVSQFFSASCVPGAANYPNLCQQCKGDCSLTRNESYYDYGGALLCLAEDAGEVAFVKHLTVPVSERDGYQLLCRNGGRSSVDNYTTCYLARVPAQAVVSRMDPELASNIWEVLEEAMETFPLFSSEGYGAKDLMFKDSTVRLVQVPPNTDSFLYLGAEYLSIIRSLDRDISISTTYQPLRWCVVGYAEKKKCEKWMSGGMSITGASRIICNQARSKEQCVRNILRNRADAVSLDEEDLLTAGTCGLVPAMAEQNNADLCSTDQAIEPEPAFYVVAVAMKGSNLTWDGLRGKRSCHTGIGHTTGWTVPLGLIHSQSQNCSFSEYFKSSCVPGAKPGSNLCALCAGSDRWRRKNVCQASSQERYFGSTGALRCLVETAADVAFLTHTTIQETIDGKSPQWAAGLQTEDFELLCPNGPAPTAPVSSYLTCHLAKVPSRTVVTRPEIRAHVVSILKEQQLKLGLSSARAFTKFKLGKNVDLLCKDSNQCLQEVAARKSMNEYLGEEYVASLSTVRQCKGTQPGLEKSCTFHPCQQRQ